MSGVELRVSKLSAAPLAQKRIGLRIQTQSLLHLRKRFRRLRHAKLLARVIRDHGLLHAELLHVDGRSSIGNLLYFGRGWFMLRGGVLEANDFDY